MKPAPSRRIRGYGVGPMPFISGAIMQCSTCESRKAPRVTNELWDAVDQVVVGCAMCEKCGARALFTRYLTPAEKRVPQVQGQPIRW